MAEGYIKEARQKIAATLKVDPKEFIITSGGTGVQQYGTYWNGTCCKEKGNHIIITAVEHPSVKATASFGGAGLSHHISFS
ncbi:MAG: aminotransferase class V-fold PLP-dependent enzyme [Lachnospiraceae bacterium]